MNLAQVQSLFSENLIEDSRVAAIIFNATSGRIDVNDGTSIHFEITDDQKIEKLQGVIEEFLHLAELRFRPEVLAAGPWMPTVRKARNLLAEINEERLFR